MVSGKKRTNNNIKWNPFQLDRQKRLDNSFCDTAIRIPDVSNWFAEQLPALLLFYNRNSISVELTGRRWPSSMIWNSQYSSIHISFTWVKVNWSQMPNVRFIIYGSQHLRRKEVFRVGGEGEGRFLSRGTLYPVGSTETDCPKQVSKPAVKYYSKNGNDQAKFLDT